ncbi:hypothetical protein Bca52824_082182 [Brassica carinata]|uniref:Uncharacterized protein n=1 Tax=Brassica carinata TaxID=52824 RepID=A0A8X7TSM0_BRACI|nr:hypothetical protein Bca52824_082182 [Brassica carinata]
MVSLRGSGSSSGSWANSDRIIATKRSRGLVGEDHGGSRTSPSSLDSLKEKVFNRYTIYSARLVMDLERFENYPWGESRLSYAELGASIGGPEADSPSPPILRLRGQRGANQ